MKRRGKWWLSVGAALIFLLLSAGSASAHAKLVRANPAPGSVLAQPPAQVQLWFDEEIEAQFSQVEVLDATRTRVDTEPLQLASDDPKSIIVQLKPLSSGTFSVVWKVLSATDGHITRGVFAFGVGQVAAPTISSEDAGAGATELTPAAAITRWLGLLSLLALLGGSFFRTILLDGSLQFVGIEKAPLYPPSATRVSDKSVPPATRETETSPAFEGGVWEGIESRWQVLTAFALVLAFFANLGELLLQADLIAESVSLQSVADVLFDTRFGALLIVRVFLLIVIATIVYVHTGRARVVIPTLSLVSVLGLFLVANSLALTRGFFLERLFSTQGLTPSQQIYLYLHHLGLFVPFVVFFGIAFYQKYSLSGLVPILGALALLTPALGSHGAAAQGDFSLAVLSDWLHLLAVSLWVGGLFYLAFLMPFVWRSLEPALRGKWIARLMSQFSIVGLVATAVIALTGLYNSVLEIPTLDALAKTLYGGTLFVKVALFAAMIAIGAVNLLFLSPRFRRAVTAPEKSARLSTRFRLTVGAEAVLGLSVIFLAGLLTIEPPARSEVSILGPALPQKAVGTRIVFSGNASPDARVQLVIGPGGSTGGEAAGGAPTQFDARVADANGQPAGNILRVIFGFTLLDADTGVQNVVAEPRADGHYVVNGSYLALDGMWRVRVIVRRKAVEDVSVEFPILVAPASAQKGDEAGARALLIASERRMNSLTSLRSVQQLNDGASGVVATNYEYHAPDRLRFDIEGEGASVAIGGLQYYQDKLGQWTVRSRVDPFVFPQFNLSNQALWVELGRSDYLDGEPTQIVRFATPNSVGTINYAYWISTRDQRLLQFAMVADGHYMMQYYRDFDAPDIAIAAPQAPVVPTPAAIAGPARSAQQPSVVATTGRIRGLITGDLETDGALVLLFVGILSGVVGAGKRFPRNVRLTAFGVALACALAGIGLFVDAVNAMALSESSAVVDAGSAARGQPLYQEYCVSCHGVAGKGDGPGGASLPVKPTDLTTHALLDDERYLHGVILDGRGYMPTFGDRLTQDQIADLVSYIRLLAVRARGGK